MMKSLEWNVITKEKNAEIIVLDFPLLDTRTKTCDLTGKFAADIVLQILSYVAQIERENTHQRQMEGIREARKRALNSEEVKDIRKDFEKIAGKWQERNQFKNRS